VRFAAGKRFVDVRQHDGPSLDDRGIRARGRGCCGDPLLGLRCPRPPEQQVLGDLAASSVSACHPIHAIIKSRMADAPAQVMRSPLRT